ncbi:MAG: type 4a pilus biogenesis protein PilO [Candidatus Omnitrophota bacterium]
MNIEYIRQQLVDSFLKDRRRAYVLIGVAIFTLIISLAVHLIQNQKIRLLLVQRGAELKNSNLLNEINISDKTIKLYKNSFRTRDVFWVMNAVSDIAKASGIKLISIKPGKEEKQPLYTSHSFNLVIEANNYHAIGKFISDIENSPDAYFVDALSIKMQEEGLVSDKESTLEAKPVSKLVVNLVLSIIIFRG